MINDYDVCTGVAPGEGTGATMSDDEEEQVDSDANLFDGGLDVADSMGFGLPTESERSLMERVRQELKHELKQVNNQFIQLVCHFDPAFYSLVDLIH